MKTLTHDQRVSLAEFFANLAVAWLAAGIIAPSLEGRSLQEALKTGVISVIWSLFSILVMLYLTKGGRK